MGGRGGAVIKVSTRVNVREISGPVKLSIISTTLLITWKREKKKKRPWNGHMNSHPELSAHQQALSCCPASWRRPLCNASSSCGAPWCATTTTSCVVDEPSLPAHCCRHSATWSCREGVRDQLLCFCLQWQLSWGVKVLPFIISIGQIFFKHSHCQALKQSLSLSLSPLSPTLQIPMLHVSKMLSQPYLHV